MAAQGKKQEKSSYAEQLAQAMQSMKGKPLPTDTEMFAGNLPKEMPERFKTKRKFFERERAGPPGHWGGSKSLQFRKF